MNERIRELVRQAVVAVDIVTGNEALDDELAKMYIPDCFSEKFAELIVRECAEQIIAKGTDWVDFAPSQTGVRPEYWDMAQQIKEHFGVEE